MNRLKIIGISGSLRENSFNTALLKNAKELSKEYMDITIYDIIKIPFYNHDLEKKGIPDEVEKFKSAISECDALLFALPEYNASVSGVIKNAIDWASRSVSPLIEKPCAIMGASGGLSGTAGAQAHFRHIAVSVNMICLNRPAIQIRKSSTIFDENLLIKDEATIELLAKFMKAFESWILNFGNRN